MYDRAIGLVETFEERKSELADGTRNLEKRGHHRAFPQSVGERKRVPIGAVQGEQRRLVAG